MTDLDLPELRRIAEAAVLGGADKPGTTWKPLTDALDPIAPTVLALLAEIERLRGAVERVEGLCNRAWFTGEVHRDEVREALEGGS